MMGSKNYNSNNKQRLDPYSVTSAIMDNEPHIHALGLEKDPGKVPLIIGVVGHIDPSEECIEKISNDFLTYLQLLIKELPNTPIWMLNGLAAGADSIAAEIFIKSRRQSLKTDSTNSINDKLIAVLPKIQANYIDDFPRSDLETFNKLIKFCDHILDPSNQWQLQLKNPNSNDSECYALQGSFLVRYSYILYSFYDGIDNGKEGGTGQSVALHQGRVHRCFSNEEEILASREPGHTIIINTQRKRGIKDNSNEVTVNDNIYSFWEKKGSDISPKFIFEYYEKLNTGIADMNQEPIFYDKDEGSFTRLWSHADREAAIRKKKYERNSIILVIIGFLLIVASSDIFGDHSAFGWCLVFISFAMFPILQKRLQRPFLTHRFLTESLTIQYLWCTSGIKQEVSDMLFTHGQTELDIVRIILRSIAFQANVGEINTSLTLSADISKSKKWIDGQISFLTKRIGEFMILSKRWRMISQVTAAAALSMSFLQLLPDKPYWISDMVSILFAAFASSYAYQQLLGYDETTARYEISLLQFNRAREAIYKIEESLPDQYVLGLSYLERHQMVISAIGKEKISELNEWMAKQLARIYKPG